MPTFKKDVKIGTIVPLVKTDDISNGAITKEKLSKDLREQIQPQPQVPTKAVKKREQIIIGKAIRMQSCDVKDAENWYVQKGRVHIYIRKKYIDYTIKVYTKEILYDTEYNFVKNLNRNTDKNQLYAFFFTSRPFRRLNKWKVDKYEISDESKIISVWLSYKTCSSTIRGTSLRYEYVNGRKVWNHSFTIGDIVKQGILISDIFLHCSILYRKGSYAKNEYSKANRVYFKKCRWKKVKRYGNLYKHPKSGVYRAVLIDKRSKRRKYFDFYYNKEECLIYKA